MIGLILLVAIGVSLWVCAWLASTLGNTVPNAAWRGTAKVGIFVVLISIPFVDEVIGMYQFNALCKANGIESADVSKARGRSVRIEVGVRSFLQGPVMPIQVEDWVYKEANTGTELLRHKDYYAIGGWLMRYTPLNMGSKHSMFAGNGCSLVVWQQTLRENQVTVIK